MNRKNLTIIFIILQILILGSFIVRFELLKVTGTTVYVPLRGYDPTDIWRGDYVNLAYELPYEGINSPYSYGGNLYLIPEIEGESVIKIRQITSTKPESGIFFQIRNGVSNQTEDFTLKSASGKTLSYHSTTCIAELKEGDEVMYTNWNMDNSDTVSEMIKKNSELKTESYYTNWKTGKLLTAGKCTGTYRFQSTAADRWFVSEGAGQDIEKKIREGNMYAKWKVGKNGAIVIVGVVGKDERK